MKSFSLITLGCPKNRVDSEVMADICLSAGLLPSRTPDGADLLILNTCAFIAPAVEESMEKLNEVLEWKGRNARRRVVLAGCLPGRYSDDGSGGLEEIDLVMGPGDYGKLARWLRIRSPRSGQSGSGVYRYVKLAEGCSNNCSYCTIPMIRGPFTPRKTGRILDSVNRVVLQGAAEVGLVAQDSGAHPDLRRVLEEATSSHPGVWFRLYYLHPGHFPSWLTGHLEETPNLVPYLDLPLQHASPRILERMGRGYGPEKLSEIAESVESLSRTVAVRATVITGYPGETDSDFEQLISFLGSWPSLRHIAAFPWWPEEGTREFERAGSEGDGIPSDLAEERLSALSSLGEALYHSWETRLDGKTLEVMADTESLGHSCYDAPESDLQAVFSRPVIPGRIYRCVLLAHSDTGMVVEPRS